MAILDQGTIDQLMANVRDPQGWQLARNSIERSNMLTEGGLQGDRMQRDFDTYDMPGLASSQAARGAYATSATGRKQTQLGAGLERGLGDIARGTTQGLNKLSLRDIASNPAFTGTNLGF